MRQLNYMTARQGRTSVRYAEPMSDRPVVRPGGRLKIDAYLCAPTPDTGALGAERLAPDVHAHRAPGRGALRAGDPLKPNASDLHPPGRVQHALHAECERDRDPHHRAIAPRTSDQGPLPDTHPRQPPPTPLHPPGSAARCDRARRWHGRQRVRVHRLDRRTPPRPRQLAPTRDPTTAGQTGNQQRTTFDISR
jgi:hypothetical protein